MQSVKRLPHGAWLERVSNSCIGSVRKPLSAEAMQHQEQITTQRLTLADPGAIKSQDCEGIVYHCLVSPQSTVERPISTEPGRVKQWSVVGRSPQQSSQRCCKSVSRVYGRR